MPLGRQDDARRFMAEFDLSDVSAAKKVAVERAARWFDGADIDEACRHLSTVELAPGARLPALLRAAGVRTVIVSRRGRSRPSGMRDCSEPTRHSARRFGPTARLRTYCPPTRVCGSARSPNGWGLGETELLRSATRG